MVFQLVLDPTFVKRTILGNVQRTAVENTRHMVVGYEVVAKRTWPCSIAKSASFVSYISSLMDHPCMRLSLSLTLVVHSRVDTSPSIAGTATAL